MHILVTGCAGFIGYHICHKLLKDNKYKVIGIDNISSYYDIKLKKNRLKIIKKFKNFNFIKIDISNKQKLVKLFENYNIKIVINLAAQAGVRHSVKHPDEYFKSNILGFYCLLDVSRKYKIKHFIFASTSSVYGDSKKFPIKEEFSTDKPKSFYAASKKTNEVMAYSYSNIYNMPCTGLRFFTVYGPFGRPDMALFKFTKSILDNKFIYLFNYGNHIRDFTYIDDVVECVVRLINKIPKSKVPYAIYNVASNNPKPLKSFIKTIEGLLGKKSKKKFKQLQKGDTKKTYADTNKIFKRINYLPNHTLYFGINKFINWYKKYKQ